MAYSMKSLIPALLFAVVVLLAGCSNPPVNPTPAPSQPPSQPADPTAVQPPQQATPGQVPAPEVVPAENLTPVSAQAQPPLPNRIDVIYFHVNQRCPTCMCFEDRVNHVIGSDFGDALNSGRLTYRVLNAQQEQNADIARQYGAVGSQLFINKVVDGKDNIKDIQEIWNWNCRSDASVFDRKVRIAIEDSLKGLP